MGYSRPVRHFNPARKKTSINKAIYASKQFHVFSSSFFLHIVVGSTPDFRINSDTVCSIFSSLRLIMRLREDVGYERTDLYQKKTTYTLALVPDRSSYLRRTDRQTD